MSNSKVLLLSNSKLYGEEIFQWCSEFLKCFLAKNNVKKVLFIPYAQHNHDKYAKTFATAFEREGLDAESIHEKPDPIRAVEECEAIFVGGGNTFLLLKTLYDNKLIEPIRDRVLNKGVPYIGSSAGTNVGTRTINTTNDMPICMPPSFDALNLVPFNINPHYIDPDANSNHMGETREQRIQEFLTEPNSAPVVGLREGSCLLMEDGKITLLGNKNAKLFLKDQDAVEYEPGSDLTFLLKTG